MLLLRMDSPQHGAVADRVALENQVPSPTNPA
jgi:hypothetical protein